MTKEQINIIINRLKKNKAGHRVRASCPLHGEKDNLNLLHFKDTDIEGSIWCMRCKAEKKPYKGAILMSKLLNDALDNIKAEFDNQMDELNKELGQLIIRYYTETRDDDFFDDAEDKEQLIRENKQKQAKIDLEIVEKKREIREITEETKRKIKILEEKTAKEIKRVKTKKVKNAIVNNSKIIQKLPMVSLAVVNAHNDGRPLNNDFHSRIDVGFKENQPIYTAICLTNEDKEGVRITGSPLTAFDRTVHNAVCTLFNAGNKSFTAKMVYKAMNGITGDINLHSDSAIIKEIKASIDKLCRCRCTLDATAQIQSFYPTVEKAKYTNYLIPVKEVGILLQNRKDIYEGYELMDIPPLFEYAQNIGHLISVDSKLLDSRGKVKNNSEIAVIREYLITRIETMKNKKAKMDNHKIKYSTLLKYAGVDENKLTQEQRNRKRAKIKKLLEYFVEQKFIKGFTEYKDGNSFVGIEIKC